jgi:hypothetical protein
MGKPFDFLFCFASLGDVFLNIDPSTATERLICNEYNSPCL